MSEVEKALGAPPPTGWAVLGLLSFGRELSGNELKAWADASLKFFYWSPSVSQIYGELKRLEQLGYVTSREVVQRDQRSKRIYQITAAGVAAVTEWVETAVVDPPVLKHKVMLRVWLGHLASPGALRTVLERHRDESTRLAVEARRDADVSRTMSGMAYPEAVLKWAEGYYEAERQLAEQLLLNLDAFTTSSPT